MKSFGWKFCTLIWKWSYIIFAIRPPEVPTVGGFWTRLVFLPVLLVLLPVHWLIVGGPVTAVIVVSTLVAFPDLNQQAGVHFGVIMFPFAWILLYGGTRPHRRGEPPESPGIYRLISWPIRLLNFLYHKYEAACTTPLQLNSNR